MNDQVARTNTTRVNIDEFSASACYCTGKGYDGKCRCERSLTEQAAYEKAHHEVSEWIDACVCYEEE